ncbi:membrane-targeted effector domain-containing toxin [Pseudomonas sp. v388]|uniref:membrane-targeted effector domain-containing toxin n=1 Tax=Pseudomonas sp. v388 TaxID=2479849 RepID=UPI001315880F|nr:membrane-targeted effector domain-containing toxin [Pseudomonas sp. v388]
MSLTPSPTRSCIDSARTGLIAIARQLAELCPDMRQQAQDIASGIIKKHTGQEIAPDTVYWHRFSSSVSSSATFTGWRHSGPPLESMTLPQLVLHRFDAQAQDYWDELDSIGGFYTAGPQTDSFDEHNEVKMHAASVMNDLWALDFSAQYRAKLEHFWQTCAEDFRALAKANFLSKALEERHSGHLADVDFQTILDGVARDFLVPVQFSMLRATATPSPGLRITAFDIGGYEASDILRIVTPHGKQILYIPGETVAIHVFHDHRQLNDWLISETAKLDDRARFLLHFPLSLRHESDNDVGLEHLLDLLPTTDASLLNKHDRDLGTDAFTWLRDKARQRMNADAELYLRSNGDLRKQMWIGYLNAFSRVLGPLAAIDWPIALAVVGAGLADMGLNIDQAVNGHTTAERKAGVIGAITSAVDVLFNSLFLLGGAAKPELPTAETDVAPTMAADAGPHPAAPTPIPDAAPVEQLDPLDGLQAGVQLSGLTPMTESGRMHGIYRLADGSTYVSLRGAAYQVRYINEMNSWAVIDPNNPFSFYRNVRIRLNAAGQWEAQASTGLRGGGPAASRLGQARVDYPNRASLYDVPDSMKDSLLDAANGGDRKVLQGDWMRRDAPHDPYEDFRAIRERLRSDAVTFFRELELPRRPAIPELAVSDTNKAALRKLLADAPGLVIGESHADIGSKKFLIDNMRLLSKLNVRTLYLEHLLNDFHLTDLKAFARTGRMPENLEKYLKILDRGHRTDPMGQYTFLELVKAAVDNHIRIQPIDCMASYRLAGMDDPDHLLRIRMMNYYAHTEIRTDAVNLSPADKWVALVGNAHANTFNGVPGISELEGTLGIRVEDVSLNHPQGFSADPGEVMAGEIGTPSSLVKSDFRLQMAVSRIYPELPVEERLFSPGMFLIDTNAGKPLLIHRASEGSVVRTPIKTSHNKFFIERPRWPAISARPFDNLGQLTDALKLMGMKDVTADVTK